MKLVIEISDEYAKQFYKNKCKDKFDNLATNEFGYVLRKAFENATPLPEHHGRLIDADWVKNILDLYTFNFNGCYGQFIRRNDIDTVPTIIEGSERNAK